MQWGSTGWVTELVVHSNIFSTFFAGQGWLTNPTWFVFSLTWPGLEFIQLLTLNQTHELRVDLEDFEGNKVFAHYKSFAISPGVVNAEADGYKLFVDGYVDGGAGKLLPFMQQKIGVL